MRPSLASALVIVAFLGSGALTGCTEKNMGKTEGGGWTKVDTKGAAAPQAPLPHAEAVNVTYYYLPG